MPIRFTCPHCGNTTDVAEQYAGQSGPCAGCGRTITVPTLGVSPFYENEPPAKRPRGKSGVWIALVSVIVVALLGCGGILAAILIPAFSAGRQVAKAMECQNNLRTIGLAMQAYHDKNGCYPPAYTTDKDGKPMHSWRVLLLPYLGQQALYNQYDMNEPWNGPHNRHLANRMPEVYRCPGETPASKNLTNYAMLVGSNAFGRPNKGRTKVQNANLPVMKIAIAETTGSGIEWLEPRDLDVDGMSFDLTAKDGQEMSSNHSGLVNVLYTDGTTQTLSEFEDSNTIKSQALFDNETPAEKKDDATDE